MDDAGEGLSCAAKLARVVLDNCGPLSARELSEEARISEADAGDALRELAAEGYAKSVCGVCSTKEEVYALTDSDPPEPRA